MKKIGLLSDTHGYWDEKFVSYFSDCDEIWHAGDIGNSEILHKLENIKPVRAVYGNIDGYPVRTLCPKHLRFRTEETEVWLTHIGGYPGHYAPDVSPEIFDNPPELFVCGHSHILKVQYDKNLKLLHINPGAAGKQGFHQVRTIIRFCIDKKDIQNLEVIEFAG
ncbi:MAG: metallophosphatase family protein [Dysgonamonadaceae bacterium]|jgi:putative phosphoesterase|nr:metallophosphatase family protein [Dysgonamonadaceae bacterium]